MLTKYYPPDFDPRALGRSKAPKQTGPKTQSVRLMSPFSMKVRSIRTQQPQRRLAMTCTDTRTSAPGTLSLLPLQPCYLSLTFETRYLVVVNTVRTPLPPPASSIISS